MSSMKLPYSVCAIAGLVGSTPACSSAYIPQPGPRLSVVMESGSLAYMRDGKKYEGGMLGGDIEEAVRGNPRAEQYAHDYKSGMVTGFALSMLGIAGMAGGLTVEGIQEANQPTGSQNVPVTGLVIFGAGLLLDLVGSSIMLGAVPHLYDAVNAFNDGLIPPSPPPPPRPAAPEPVEHEASR
jgi:hypothetical protein